MTTVREIMKTTLYSVDPSTTVGEAISLMARNRIGSAMIMEGGRLIGIFTERDTVRAISQAYDAPTHEISSWMTRDPKTVSPDADADDALKTMLENSFRHLPVVEGAEVVGMISMRDLAAEQQ